MRLCASFYFVNRQDRGKEGETRDRDGLGWEMKPLQVPGCWLVEAIDWLVLLRYNVFIFELF